MIFNKNKRHAASKPNAQQEPNLQDVLALSATPAAAVDHYKNLPTELRVSKAVWNAQTKRLTVNGWLLTTQNDGKLFVEVPGTSVLVSVPLNQEARNDVHKNYPQYGNKNSGWRIVIPLGDFPQISETVSVRANFVAGSQEHITFDAPIQNMTAPQSDPIGAPVKQLQISNCSYSPMRGMLRVNGTVVTTRTDLQFELSHRDGGKISNVHVRLSPQNQKGERRWTASAMIAGLPVKDALVVHETSSATALPPYPIKIANDSPRRIQAMRPSVQNNTQLLENHLTLQDMLALKQSLQGISTPVEKNHTEICYFPPFDTVQQQSDHYHRASWYLTGDTSPISQITLAGPAEKPDDLDAPASFFAKNSLSDQTLALIAAGPEYLDRLCRAQTILVWRPIPKGLQDFLSSQLGKATVIPVATQDPGAVEYGNYCRSPWMLLPAKDRQDLLQQSQDRFIQIMQSQRSAGKTSSAIFGTGPSIDTAFDFDFSTSMSVACNSIVANDALLDHIQPTFICAGDAVSHFGVSAYAETFRQDLIRTLRTRDIYFFTSAAIGFLLIQKHPEIRDRVILCEQGFTGPNCDLETNWSLPRFDSTLNIHMLPIATTFSDTTYLLGLDGRNPAPADEAENEDFWAHSKAAQYHDLVDSGHLAHPTFAENRAQATEGRYLASVEDSFLSGEAVGKRFFSLAESYTPPVHARPAPAHCFTQTTAGKPRPLSPMLPAPARTGTKKRALITSQITRRYFSGGRYHGTMLAEAMTDFCDEVVVWANNMPPWSGDLSFSPTHNNVQYWINDFTCPPDGDFDYMVMLPDGAQDPDIYFRVLDKARSCNAKTAFINFESPNWFNALSPAPKKISDFSNWFAATCFCDIVLSSAKTAVPFAETFYQTLFQTPEFAVAPPAINSPIADLVLQEVAQGKFAQEKQITLISRFKNASAHKNINAIFDCITPEMNGYTLALIAGTSELPDAGTLDNFRAQLAERGMSLKLLYMISDRQKFEEIAKSELMIFPSLFEGFGYPPVEAGYMGTPCVAYDLPVLQEFSADHCHFVPWGDVDALRTKVSELLQMPTKKRLRTRSPKVRQTATLQAFADNLRNVFHNTPPAQAAAAFSEDKFRLARQVYLDGCQEPQLSYGGLSPEDIKQLYTLYSRYSQAAREALEKLDARTP